MYHHANVYPSVLDADGNVIDSTDDEVLDVHWAVFVHVVPLLFGLNVYVVPFILPHVPLLDHPSNVYVVVFVIVAFLLATPGVHPFPSNVTL